MYQTHAGAAFQRAQALADNSQRHTQAAGRSRQAAFYQDRPEGLQLVKIVQHSFSTVIRESIASLQAYRVEDKGGY
jgi:hypothetical protein